MVNRYEVTYGRRRGIVHVTDARTGETVGTWATGDALLNATEEANRLNARDRQEAGR